MKKLAPLVVVAALVCGGIIYLQKSGGADETRPIAEVKTEAAELDADGLRKMAEEYKDALLAKRDDVKALELKLKDIPPAELLGESAAGIKDDLAELMKSATALQQRLGVYVEELKAKGGDVSGLEG